MSECAEYLPALSQLLLLLLLASCDVMVGRLVADDVPNEVAVSGRILKVVSLDNTGKVTNMGDVLVVDGTDCVDCAIKVDLSVHLGIEALKA